MLIYARVIVTWALVAAILAGCDARPTPADYSGRVLFEDDNLACLVAVDRQESDRIAGDLLRIRSDIRNRTDRDLEIEIQVIWNDRAGFPKYSTPWQPFHLPARFVTTHQINSQRADVADYEMRLRRPKRPGAP